MLGSRVDDLLHLPLSPTFEEGFFDCSFYELGTGTDLAVAWVSIERGTTPIVLDRLRVRTFPADSPGADIHRPIASATPQYAASEQPGRVATMVLTLLLGLQGFTDLDALHWCEDLV